MSTKWPVREKVLIAFIPTASNVIDLGGSNGGLFKSRPDFKSYVCIDYDRRANPTYFADFNKGQFPDIQLENAVIVCQGLLEHLNDVPSFLKTIRKYGDYLVMTYYQRKQRYECWKNHYTYVNILDILDKAGWEVTHIEPVQVTTELLFVCQKIGE